MSGTRTRSELQPVSVLWVWRSAVSAMPFRQNSSAEFKINFVNIADWLHADERGITRKNTASYTAKCVVLCRPQHLTRS
eukprot:6183794-Pleurochrysis_carterae.AAC.4